MRVECTCRTCGTVFTKKPSDIAQGRGLFCSVSCYRQQQRLRLTTEDQRTALLSHGVRSGACLLWDGLLAPNGYGRTRMNGRQRFVHRAAYEAFIGPIPDGLQVQHSCNVRHCFEPSHLSIGAPHENSAYMVQCGRAAAGDRHPMRLHPDRRARGDYHGARLHPERWTRGEQRYNAKLTEAIVREMRVRHRNGEAAASLAAEYGVKPATAKSAIRRRSWAHVI